MFDHTQLNTEALMAKSPNEAKLETQASKKQPTELTAEQLVGVAAGFRSLVGTFPDYPKAEREKKLFPGVSDPNPTSTSEG